MYSISHSREVGEGGIIYRHDEEIKTKFAWVLVEKPTIKQNH